MPEFFSFVSIYDDEQWETVSAFILKWDKRGDPQYQFELFFGLHEIRFAISKAYAIVDDQEYPLIDVINAQAELETQERCVLLIYEGKMLLAHRGDIVSLAYLFKNEARRWEVIFLNCM